MPFIKNVLGPHVDAGFMNGKPLLRAGGQMTAMDK